MLVLSRGVMLSLSPPLLTRALGRSLSTSCPRLKKVSGRYKVTLRRDRPLTYEQAHKPNQIGHDKAWNSWNTSNLLDGVRRSESATEDFFIRRFVAGTWHRLLLSELIIKRRGNVLLLAGLVLQGLHPRKLYFLTGYTEQLLSYVLKCPVKMELQTVAERKDVVFKYI